MKGSAPMLAVKMSGVAPEVNLRNPLHASDETHKQWDPGVSVATQKGLMSSTNFKKIV